MITCTKRYTDIPFAHRQPAHNGHCRHIHGHNWAFEFQFLATDLDSCGFVVDFGKLREVKDWLDKFDHALVLNEDDPLVKDPTVLTSVFIHTSRNLMTVKDCSCEGLAYLALSQVDKIVHEMTLGRVYCIRCTVWEDLRNSATATKEAMV